MKIELLTIGDELLDGRVADTNGLHLGQLEAVGAGGLVERVLQLCRARGLTLGTAESCTGGLIAGALTAPPGASDVVVGGIVAYANDVKRSRLGVSAAILAEHGAVSGPCAAAMARGALTALGCDLALSVTGVAGPGGGTPETPVGTVWFAWAGPDLCRTRRRQLRGDRDRVRRSTVVLALDGLRRWLVNPDHVEVGP